MKTGMIFLVVSFSLLQGCSVTYYAYPANELKSYSGRMCIIENPAVRAEFVEAYKPLLEERGFSVEIIPEDSALDTCKLTSTYFGKWSWDFKYYMASAKISIYQKGVRIGMATYDTPKEGWSLTFKIYESTETKIRGMLDKLLPNSK